MDYIQMGTILNVYVLYRCVAKISLKTFPKISDIDWLLYRITLFRSLSHIQIEKPQNFLLFILDSLTGIDAIRKS